MGQESNHNLRNKAVLITGAGGGLGRAIAQAFAREGANLYLVDLKTEDLQETANSLQAFGIEIRLACLDLSEMENCRAAVTAAVDAYGRLDVLCNNAAILRFHRVIDVTDEAWSKILAVNLTAPFVLSQAAIPHLLKSSGSIVNVASSGGIVGTAYTTPYSTAKAGLIHMTKCMAMEYARESIRINAVAPGAMRTGIGADLVMPEGLDQSLIARYSGLRPAVDPAEVAELILFVASGRGAAIHGACLSADSGVTAG